MMLSPGLAESMAYWIDPPDGTSMVLANIGVENQIEIRAIEIKLIIIFANTD